MSLTIENEKFTIFGSGYEQTRNDSGDGSVDISQTLKIVDPNGVYLGDITFEPPVANVNPFGMNTLPISGLPNYGALKNSIIANGQNTILDYPKDVLYLVDVTWIQRNFYFWQKMHGDVINKYLVIGDNLVKDTRLYLGDIGDSSYIKVKEVYERVQNLSKDPLLEYYTKNDVLVYTCEATAVRRAGSENLIGECWYLPWLACYDPFGTYAMSGLVIGYNDYGQSYNGNVVHGNSGFQPTSVAKAQAFWRNEEYI